MTHPFAQRAREILATFKEDDPFNPTKDQQEAVQSLLMDLVMAHSQDWDSAHRLVSALYWGGWNKGWAKGYEHYTEYKKNVENN